MVRAASLTGNILCGMFFTKELFWEISQEYVVEEIAISPLVSVTSSKDPTFLKPGSRSFLGKTF